MLKIHFQNEALKKKKKEVLKTMQARCWRCYNWLLIKMVPYCYI